jgi:tetratricopeptide (TPR) repeat protein
MMAGFASLTAHEALQQVNETEAQLVDVQQSYDAVYSDKELLRGFGNAMIRRNDPNVQLFTMNQALEEHPNVAYGYVLRAIIQQEQGNDAAALEDYYHALELDPQQVFAHYNIGALALHNGDIDTALSRMDRVIEIDPTFEHAYLVRGDVYSILGDSRQAILEYSQVLELNPESVAALEQRGTLYYVLGMDYYENARADFTQYAELTGAMEPYMYNIVSEITAVLDNNLR